MLERFLYMQSCAYVIDGLRGSISEEAKQLPYEERRHFEYFWVVDPLDGTKVSRR